MRDMPLMFVPHAGPSATKPVVAQRPLTGW